MRVRTFFLGSLDKTCTLLEIEPALSFISILAIISPFSPGFRRLELATTAVHPHDGVNFSMMSSSFPVFVKSKLCSIVSDLATVPKS